VTTMPSHKQAGHTTVLTKKTAKYHYKTLAMQEPSTQDLDWRERCCGAASLKRTFIHHRALRVDQMAAVRTLLPSEASAKLPAVICCYASLAISEKTKR
jgi:hypothetical protein